VLRSTVKALEIVQRAFFFAIGNPYGFTTALILVSVQIRMMMLARAGWRQAERLRSMSIGEFRRGRSIGSASRATASQTQDLRLRRTIVGLARAREDRQPAAIKAQDVGAIARQAWTSRSGGAAVADCQDFTEDRTQGAMCEAA
jgi:hypothetical protein